MADYAVGDIQGCFAELQAVLAKANFQPDTDTLWCCGDLVNRGPSSLETLRFIKDLPHTRVVLGNHDLHLLAIAHGAKKHGKKDTLGDVLKASDCEDLLDWLRKLPLFEHDSALDITMVHAGIPPIWSIEEAREAAAEVEAYLRSDEAPNFFQHMYGNEPGMWNRELSGFERLRVITNYLTRMRFCSADGRLELTAKDAPEFPPEGFKPWYDHPRHKCLHRRIIFGHWAALEGRCPVPTFHALDTGCVWNGVLSLMRLQDSALFQVKAFEDYSFRASR